MTRPPATEEEEIFEAATLPAAQVGVRRLDPRAGWLALASLAGLWGPLWLSGWEAWWEAQDWGHLAPALSAGLALLWGTVAHLRGGLTLPGLFTLGALSLAVSAPRLAELDALALLLGPLALGAALWWTRPPPVEEPPEV